MWVGALRASRSARDSADRWAAIQERKGHMRMHIAGAPMLVAMLGLPIADRWFDRESMSSGVTRLWEPHVHPFLRCNIFHVVGRDRDVVIDTGIGVSSVAGELVDLIDKPVVAVATHSHSDHVGGLEEFDTRLMHPLEAPLMNPYSDRAALMRDEYDADSQEYFTTVGYELGSECLLSALPHQDFDVRGHEIRSAPITTTIDEGDVIDLGDRMFEVLHLPGHSPGSIGLFEAATETLFSGDAIYDGPLLDQLPESDIDDYIKTMTRLRNVRVEVVHGGHEPSFGRARLIELVDRYLASNS